jgi:hypothetical protein
MMQQFQVLTIHPHIAFTQNFIVISVETVGIKIGKGSCSRLAWPDLICNRTNELQFLLHILNAQRIPQDVARKSALGTYAHPFQCCSSTLVSGLTDALSDDISCAIHPCNHLALVFQLREFGCDDTQNDILVLRQVLQGFETARTWSIIFEIEGGDVEVLEELGGYPVVATLGEMTRADEVPTADVQTDVHLAGMLFNALIVESDICVELLVGS